LLASFFFPFCVFFLLLPFAFIDVVCFALSMLSRSASSAPCRPPRPPRLAPRLLRPPLAPRPLQPPLCPLPLSPASAHAVLGPPAVDISSSERRRSSWCFFVRC
jgi:hypothetical protein